MLLAFCCYYVQLPCEMKESAYNHKSLLSPLLPHRAMVKYKWCTCQQLCNGGVQVHERSYLWHDKHQDLDTIHHHDVFSEQYGTLDVNPHIKPVLVKKKRKIVR